jgi:hypothetical protein
MDQQTWQTIGWVFLGCAGAALLGALALLGVTIYQLRRTQLRPGMGFVETLWAVPITLVIGLDLLDFALDVFSAPVSWLLLSYLKLEGLVAVTVIKDLVPFTQAIPALTFLWLGVRLVGLRPGDPRIERIQGIFSGRRFPTAR